MRTNPITIPTDQITDWDSFHSAFQQSLGFPAYYGRNMDAWIDCMTYADDAEAGMVAEPVSKGDLLTLQLNNAAEFETRCPEQYKALIECAAFVNYRRMERGGQPILALLIEGWFGRP